MFIVISTPFENYLAAATLVEKLFRAVVPEEKDPSAEVWAVTGEGNVLAQASNARMQYLYLWPNGNLYSDETNEENPLVVEGCETFIADYYTGMHAGGSGFRVAFAVQRAD